MGWDPSRSSEEPDDAKTKQGTGRGDWSAFEMCVWNWDLRLRTLETGERQLATAKRKRKKGSEKERNLATSGGRIGDVIMMEPMEPNAPTNPAPAELRLKQGHQTTRILGAVTVTTSVVRATRCPRNLRRMIVKLGRRTIDFVRPRSY